MSLDELFEHNATWYSDSLVPVVDASSHSIRVLHIQPGLFDDPIKCDLATIQLDGVTRYTALSYVWGLYETPQTIEINGKADFWVTHNAFAAIRRLRQHNKNGLTVWIDAICIKQTDIGERNSQVSIMGDIYRKAKTVFIYLGCCSGQPLGQSELETCKEQTLHEDIDLIKDQSRSDEPIGSILQFNEDEDDDDDADKYQWWQRCWTVSTVSVNLEPELTDGFAKFQESLLACETLFLIGPHRYTLTQMEDLASTAYLPQKLCLSLLDLNGEGPPGELRPDHRDADDDEEESMIFFRLLQATAPRHATDPRDKVYSVLSMIGKGRPTVKVDYSKALETVAYETTIALLESADKVDRPSAFNMLQRSIGFSYRTPWISWIPDFCSPGLLRQGNLYDSLGIDGAKHRYGRKASRTTSETFSITDATLLIQALMFDSIAFKVESTDLPARKDVPKGPLRAQWLFQRVQDQLKDCKVNLRHHKRDLAALNKHKDEPEWHTIQSSRTQMDRLAHRLSYAGVMEKRYSKLTFDHAKREKDLGYRILHAFSSKESTRTSLDWTMISNMIFPGSCFFITTSGFIGFSTSAAQVGDTVAVVFTFPEVMILRKTSEANPQGTYRLVSEAIVPSIQDGQLVQLHKKGKMQARDITLV